MYTCVFVYMCVCFGGCICLIGCALSPWSALTLISLCMYSCSLHKYLSNMYVYIYMYIYTYVCARVCMVLIGESFCSFSQFSYRKSYAGRNSPTHALLLFRSFTLWPLYSLSPYCSVSLALFAHSLTSWLNCAFPKSASVSYTIFFSTVFCSDPYSSITGPQPLMCLSLSIVSLSHVCLSLTCVSL